MIEILDTVFKLAVLFYVWCMDVKISDLQDEIKQLKKKGSENN